MNRLRLAPALALLVALQAGCKSEKTVARTEVLLQVDADRPIRLEAERMTLELASGAANSGMLSAIEPELFDLTSEDFRWPASLALIAKPGHEDHVFQVTITVEKGGESMARGRVRSAFLKHETLLLKTSLFTECIGKLDCGDDETCVGRDGRAECVSAEVAASELPKYDPELGFGQGGSGGDGGRGGQGGSGGSDAGPDELPDSGPADTDAAADSGGGGPDGGGSGGSGGSDADSGTDGGSDSGPTCVSSGPEQCDNGEDDDCNGDVDCADAACSSMTCAPVDATTGVLVPSGDACPSGFEQGELLMHQGLTDPGCSGCSCSTSATECVPRVYYYANTAACNSDLVAPYTGGTLVNSKVTYTCSSEPYFPSYGAPEAWRVVMNTYPGSCSAAGSPSPLPPVWGTSMKLCTTSTRGGGCAPGFTCVPKVTGKQHCAQRSGGSCPSDTSAQTWQRGFSDNRSCGLCGCQVSGGNCNDVEVIMGHDWSCGSIDSRLHGGEKDCSVSTYAPPVQMVGSPTNATCSASAAVNGTLFATQPVDLCCAN